MHFSRSIVGAALLAAGLSLSGCNGGSSGTTTNASTGSSTSTNTTYTVGGTVSGLPSGKSVTLQDNGGDTLTVNSTTGINQNFTFVTALASGASYAVTVSAQPAGMTCAVTNGSGTMASSNVSTVGVSCTSTSLHHLYVSDAANYLIYQYSINADGTLTPLSPATVSTPAGSSGMAINPAGTFVFATLNSLNEVASYAVQPDGTLNPTPVSQVPTSSGPYLATVSPNGNFLIVGTQDVYTISNTGALTLVGGGTTCVGNSPCSNPQGIVVDASNTNVYLVGAYYSYINHFTLSSGGVLTYQNSISANVTNPNSVAIDPSGQYLVTASGSNITTFNIDPTTGDLSYLNNTPLTGNGALPILFNTASNTLYVGMSVSPGQVDQFGWDIVNGLATPYTPNSQPAGAGLTAMAMDSSNSFIYTANRNDGSITELKVAPGDGSLTPIGTVTLPAIPAAPPALPTSPDPYALVAH